MAGNVFNTKTSHEEIAGGQYELNELKVEDEKNEGKDENRNPEEEKSEINYGEIDVKNSMGNMTEPKSAAEENVRIDEIERQKESYLDHEKDTIRSEGDMESSSCENKSAAASGIILATEMDHLQKKENSKKFTEKPDVNSSGPESKLTNNENEGEEFDSDDVIECEHKTTCITARAPEEDESAMKNFCKPKQSDTDHDGASSVNDIEMEDSNLVNKDKVAPTNFIETAITLHEKEDKTTDSHESSNYPSIENEDISSLVKTKGASEGKKDRMRNSENSHESYSKHIGDCVTEKFSIPMTSIQSPGYLDDGSNYNCGSYSTTGKTSRVSGLCYDSTNDPVNILKLVEQYQQKGEYSLARNWSEYGLECSDRSLNNDLYMMFAGNLMQLYLLMDEAETALAVYESCLARLVMVNDPKVIQSFIDIHALCLKKTNRQHSEVPNRDEGEDSEVFQTDISEEFYLVSRQRARCDSAWTNESEINCGESMYSSKESLCDDEGE